MFEFLKRPAVAATVASLIGVAVILIASSEYERAERVRFQQEYRTSIVRDLATVRGQIEIAINKRVHLTTALKTHVSVNPGMSEEEFSKFAAKLMNEAEGIRSVTSIKDNIINDVYPRQGNEQALNTELMKIPQQRAAVERAMKTGKGWLAGPVDLVQGGKAFINRAPVFVPNEDPNNPRDQYWGLVSILIDMDTLVAEIESVVPQHLTVAIRNTDERDRPNEFFLGDSTIVSQDPIKATISLPTGSWELYGVPKPGWNVKPPGTSERQVFSFAMALVFGAILFSIVITQLKKSTKPKTEATTEESAPPALTSNPWNYVAVIFPVVLTLTGAYLVYSTMQQAEQRRIRAEVDTKAKNAMHAIHTNFQHYLASVEAVRSLYDANRTISRDGFERFVHSTLEQNSGIRAIEWVPRVRRADREMFEVAARNAGIENFQFRQWSPAKNAWLATEDEWADEYYPVFYVQPVVQNEAAFGIDLASNEDRWEALQRARDEGRPTATKPIKLVQSDDDQLAVLVFVPLYRKQAIATNKQQRREELVGCALGVFEIHDLINASLSGLDIRGLNCQFTDRTEEAAGQQQAIYQVSTGSRLSKTKATIAPDDSRNTIATNTENFAGRTWELTLTASPEYISEYQTYQPQIVLISGVLVALLLGLAMTMLTGRTTRIEQSVMKRTAELRRAQQQLHREREETQLILDSIPSYVFLKDRENRIIRVNRAAADSLGLPREDIEGRLAREIYPNDADRFFKDDLTVMNSGNAKTGYTQPIGDRWGQTDKIPVRNESGEIDHILVVVTDVTDKKRAEELIRLSFEASPTGMLMVNADREIVMANQSVVKMLGKSDSGLVGSTIDQLLPERFRAAHQDQFAEFFQSPEARPMGSGRKLTAIGTDGQEFPVEIGLTPVETNDGIHVLASIVNLKERLRRETELHDAQELLKKTSEMAKIGGWELKLDTMTPVWSDEVCRIHGRPVGHRPELDEAIAYYTDDSRPIIEQAVGRAIDEHEPWDLQLAIDNAQGDRVWVRTIGQPEVIDGECVRLWGTFQDVSERITVEAERDKFFGLSLDLFCVANMSGYFERLNPAWSEKLGYSTEELCSKPFFEFIHPDDREATTEAMGQLTRGEDVSGFVNRYVRKDGSSLWLEWAAAAPTDGEHTLYAVARDVTESKEYERNLESLNEELASRAAELAERTREAEVAGLQSEKIRTQLELALTGANVGLWDWNARTNEVYYSPTFKAQIGYDRDEEWENSFDDWRLRLHPDDQEQAMNRVNDYFEHKTDEYESIFRFQCKDGSYRWILSQGKAEFDDDGKPGRMVGVHVDITDRTRAQELLEKMSQMAQIGAWEVDFKTMSPIWSDEVCRIHEVPLGYQPTLDEAVSFYSEESRPHIDRAVTRALDESIPWDMELSLRTAQDNLVWVRAVGQPEVENGKCVRLWGTFQDVTERKKAEQQLKLTQQVVDYSNDAVFFIGNDGGIIYANEQASIYLDYTRLELCHMYIGDISPQHSEDDWSRQWQEVRSSGHLIFESQQQRKDGSTFECEIRASFHEFQEQQILVFAVRDIAQAKRDAELRNVLFERSTNAHLLFDNTGIIECNNAAVEMLRLDNKQDVFAKHPAELSPEFQPDGQRSIEKSVTMDSIARQNGYHRFEWIHTRADGSEFPCEVTLNPVEVSSGDALLVEWHDLTDQKRQETLLREKNAEMEQFLYIVSHDLKSPLVTVEGFTGMAQRDLSDGDTEKAIERLGRVTKACKKMGRLINELLELSRVNRATLKLKPCQIQNVIEDVRETLAIPLRKADARICIDELSASMMADESLLEQLFQNLIENALKYGCPNPGMEIRIRSEDYGSSIRVFVEDDGPGIPTEYHERIFKPFDRLSNDKEGTGLGLAIVAKAIQHHEGEIWVESDGSSGTTFVLQFPKEQSMSLTHSS